MWLQRRIVRGGMAAASAGSLPVQQQQSHPHHGPGSSGTSGSGIGMHCGQAHPLGAQQPHLQQPLQFLGKAGLQLSTNPSQQQQQHHNSLHQASSSSSSLLPQSTYQQQQSQPNLVTGWKRVISNGDIVYLR